MSHWAALTGVTDRRAWRTGAISASLSPPFISASMTVRAIGLTAFMVTMLKRPLASVGSG